jgi:5-hydroxyisourate hydrolase-like protein (transthyretin family)
MEAEYFKKIRDLKNTLIERTRKQAALNSEVTLLKEEFKNHQQEISKITEEITNEKGRSNEPKPPKKNSSPGLLKKSLECEKKFDKRMSPTAHTSISTNIKINKSETTINSDDGVKPKEARKGYSPINNMKKMTQLFPQNNK